MAITTHRDFTVKAVVRSLSKARSSAVDVTIGPPDHVRVSIATVTARPSTSAVNTSKILQNSFRSPFLYESDHEVCLSLPFFPACFIF